MIVVDDASEDDTAARAEGAGARTLRLERQRGPAVARNRGTEIASADILCFLDADVLAHPDTLSSIASELAEDPSLDALFGSYDTHPTARNPVSQYRNLLHHFTHQHAREEATTFWAGCGAIRRLAFFAIGGFSQDFDRPCIEDIELGARLKRAGYSIALKKRIQVSHAKRWTLSSVFKTDVVDRGIPWTRLLLAQRLFPDDLNLKRSQRISTVLAYLSVAAFVLGAWQTPVVALLPVVTLLALSWMDRRTTDAPTSNGFHESAALDERPNGPRPPSACRDDDDVGLRVIERGFSAPALPIGLTTAGVLAASANVWTLGAAASVLGIVLINLGLYRFFVRERGILATSAYLVMHLTYFLSCGAAFGLGCWFHWRDARSGPRAGEVETALATR